MNLHRRFVPAPLIVVGFGLVLALLLSVFFPDEVAHARGGTPPASIKLRPRLNVKAWGGQSKAIRDSWTAFWLVTYPPATPPPLCASDPSRRTEYDYARSDGAPRPIGDVRPYSQISVSPCEPGATAYTYTLTGPNGEEEVTISNSSVYFDIDFEEPAGGYTLTITAPDTEVVKDFRFGVDSLPQLRLLDASPGMQLKKLRRGQSAVLDIHGYQPGEQLQISFYGPPEVAEPEKQESTRVAYAPLVVEPWQVTANEAGTYRAAIPFPAPPDVESGMYTVTACPVDCPMYFVGNGVMLPKMEWTTFDVDPVPLAHTVATRNGSAIRLTSDLFGDAKKTSLTGPSTRDPEPDVFLEFGDWSVGSNRIAYQANLQGTYDIWTQERTDTGEFSVNRLTFDQRSDEWEPDWSPDGLSILYRAGGDQDGQGELRTESSDGAQDQLLAGRRILGHAPTWSPDGKRVAYDAKRPGSMTYQVYVFDLETGKERQITRCQTNCRFPNWSSDGTYLAYHSTLGVMEQTPQIIWRVRSDGAEAPQALVRGQEPGRPVWTPDGAIIFESRNGLETITADGDSRTPIPGTAGSHAPDTPFSRKGTTSSDIEAVPTDTSERTSDDDFIIIDSDEQPVAPQNGEPAIEMSQSSSAFFQLAWVPRCDPMRAEVALLRPGQHACDPGVETWSLERLAETLADRILRDGEKLLPLPSAGKTNQLIGIFDREGQQSGWLDISESGEVLRGAYPSLPCQLQTSTYQWECSRG